MELEFYSIKAPVTKLSRDEYGYSISVKDIYTLEIFLQLINIKCIME